MDEANINYVLKVKNSSYIDNFPVLGHILP